MVRQCVFPLCPNKMTTSSKFSFHRLPLDYPALLKVWLVALKMDPNTEIEDLKRASHRVCSAHFAPEDFIRTKPKKKGQEPQRQNLKRSAIPTVSEGATDAAEVMEEVKEVEPTEGTEGAELLMLCDEDEMEVFPQEMEREEKEETKGGHNREETTNLAAVESMENARMGQVSVQPESSSTQGNTLNTTQKDTLNNTSNNREKGAPLGFKVNGRLVSLQPGGGAAELKLSSYPRGSASGFTKVQVSIHPSFQQPAETDASTASAQTGADFTPIITGVVSGEAAQRVLSDHSTNIPLTERNSQPRASNLTSQETSCTSRRPQEKGQLGPSPPDCLACRSQYQFIPKLRGFMCLCSPAIALSLKNLEDKRRRSSHRRSRDKNRNSRSYRDSQTFKPPRTLSRPEPPASQCEASQSKLVILVDDFYYGSAPGRLSTNNETGGENCGPYQCSQCQSTLHNNIELMNHMKFHITKPQLDRRRDSLTLCPHCFRHFTSPLSLQCHLEAVHNQCKPSALCKICELAFSTEAIFLSHMKSTHKPGEMPYTCQVCDFRSSFYADVWSHFESHHADSEHLLCPFCLRVMNSSMSYQQHVGRHQRKHVFGCERCRLHFLYDNEQIQHDLIHHRTYVKPAQLTGLRPGTKVTVRTYSVVRPAEAKEGLNKTSPSKAVDLEPPPPRQGALKRKLVESLGGLLSSLSQESTSDGVSDPSPLCVECMSSVHDFKTHFPSVVRCSVCSFLTCCCTAYANHMISNHAVQTTAPEYANIFQSRPRLSEKLECVSCTFSTHRGDIMANHLTERPEHRCVMLLNDIAPSNESPPADQTCDDLLAPLEGGEEPEEFCETSDGDMKPEMETDEQKPEMETDEKKVDIKEEEPCDPAYGMTETMQTPNQVLPYVDQKPFIGVSQHNLQGLVFGGPSRNFYYHLIDERGQSHNISNPVFLQPTVQRPVNFVRLSRPPRVMPPPEQAAVQDASNNPVKLTQIYQHIESFYPTMSHYGRNHDHDQRFLPSDVSLRVMFDDFATTHRTSLKRYQKALASYNVSFSRPGEEPCDLCLQHQHHMSVRHRDHDWVTNLQEPPPDCSTCSLWEEHQERMEQATRYYKRDARKPQSDEVSIRRVDLQRVILLPRMPGVKQALTSKRVSVFHETFATISQRRGAEKKSISVIWHEGVALRKAVEVASAYVCGLQREWNVPHVVLWLDGSTAQYRNWCLVTTLITLVNQNWNRTEDLTLKYFEPGHTFITTDCFHQRVEREMDSRPGGRVLDFQDFRRVVASAQWGDVEVVEMQNEDIRVWKEGNSRRKLTNTPPLPELAQIQFRKGSRLLWVKLSHDQEEFTPVDFLRNRTRLNIPEPLRSAEQGIGKRKKMEILMNLGRLMPPQSRLFWEGLAESAEDDEDDEDDDEEEEDEEEGEDE
ncbi:uncharacterized protein pogza isoform X2 [Halichoeres trimaculatus]|uniref:uncharacterized protein pogza isoform X2 n=1 Tax=Halichoeres trimaculatus TaxID=147232 RepID=UPI003D9F9F3F